MDTYRVLNLNAQSFDDFQRMRIQLQNRRRALLDIGDVTGEFDEILDDMAVLENRFSKVMRKSLRQTNPALIRWQKETSGIGEHLLARLIGVIGDPVFAAPKHWEDNPDFNENELSWMIIPTFVRYLNFGATVAWGTPPASERSGCLRRPQQP